MELSKEPSPFRPHPQSLKKICAVPHNPFLSSSLSYHFGEFIFSLGVHVGCYHFYCILPRNLCKKTILTLFRRRAVHCYLLIQGVAGLKRVKIWYTAGLPYHLHLLDHYNWIVEPNCFIPITIVVTARPVNVGRYTNFGQWSMTNPTFIGFEETSCCFCQFSFSPLFIGHNTGSKFT